MRILMTGATGLIGREIGKVLAEKGHEILVVSRSERKAREVLPFPCEVIQGDLSQGKLKDDRLESVEAVIHLLGEPVAGQRWTEERKKKIYSSRVDGTRNLVQSLPADLKIFVSGSAIGIYGDRGETVLSEEDKPGGDFLARVCVDWELEAAKAPGRKVFVRTGVVLAREGGAMDQMLFPFRCGIGGILGNGRQWMSWIHLRDIVGLFVFAFENPHVEGPINGVAPQAVSNREFSTSLVKALGSRLGPPVPMLALKVLFGEMAQVIAGSIRSSAARALTLGYRFHFENLDEALQEICAPFRQGEEVFVAEQFVPESPEQLFTFFKEAHNLEKITPASLNFHIEKMSTPEIRQGTIIDYKLRIHGVPAAWKTEIDEWQPPYKFVDNQVKGPYRLWHHTHEFRPFCGGTLMVDKVRYRLPMGFLGWVVASQMVRKEVEGIFAFRRRFIADFASHADR